MKKDYATHLEEMMSDTPVITTYTIQDSEAGSIIDTFDSLSEALDAVMEWECEDKKTGYYTTDFYKIVKTTI